MEKICIFSRQRCLEEPHKRPISTAFQRFLKNIFFEDKIISPAKTIEIKGERQHRFFSLRIMPPARRKSCFKFLFWQSLCIATGYDAEGKSVFNTKARCSLPGFSGCCSRVDAIISHRVSNGDAYLESEHGHECRGL